jgi:flavin-dependent thymidylate synthase
MSNERNSKAEVSLLNYTDDAERLLVFMKRTRRQDSEAELDWIYNHMPQSEIDEELDYIFKTISGPWEFVDYTFLIKNVTRAFTHQLVRHRVGTSFSQQSLRIANLSEDFDYLATNNADMCAKYHNTMEHIHTAYKLMIEEEGVSVEDARGILPTNILTDISMKINLRALNTMMNTRLCIRTQGEFRDVALQIRNLVLEVHPWAEPALLPFCLEWGACKFKAYRKCPIKVRNPILRPYDHVEDMKEVKKDWEKYFAGSYQPK